MPFIKRIAIIGCILFVLFGVGLTIRSRLTLPEISVPSNTETPAPQTLSTIPIGVALTPDTTWFTSWATDDDLLVIFGERTTFDNLPSLSRGKIAWNVPSLAHIKQTQSEWEGNIDMIIYDYELWEKTPKEERDNPDEAARDAQALADSAGVELLMGTSWQVSSEGITKAQIRNSAGTIDWNNAVNRETVQAIARNVRNYGTNATGLRSEYPDAYVEFFKAVGDVSREVNPDIKLWPILDARNQTAQEMYDMLVKLTGSVDGVLLMGTASEQPAITELLSLLRP